MIRQASLFVAIGALMVGAGGAHATIVIDNFTTGQFGPSLLSAPTTVNQVGSMLGGEREVFSLIGSPTVAVAGGAFTMTAPSFTILGLTYDGVGSAGLGGFDATSGGGDRFTVNFGSPTATLNAVVRVDDTSGNFDVLFARGVSGSTDFLFTNFVGMGAAFSNLDRIQLTLITTASDSANSITDFSLPNTEAPIPEPSSLLLSGLGLAGIGLLAFLARSSPLRVDLILGRCRRDRPRLLSGHRSAR